MTDPPARLDGLTVLLVHAHQDTGEVLREYLESAGARVIPAHSAKAALGFAATFTPDVVLIDLELRGDDGWSLLRQLRTSRTPTARGLIFAITSDRHEPPSGEGGFTGSFFNPIDLDHVVMTLARLRPV